MEDSKNKNIKKTPILCKICKIELPNQASMMQHVLGQRHKKLYSSLEETKHIEDKCGIYVKGYPFNLAHSIILEYFSKFGNIIWAHFGNSFLLLDYTKPAAAEAVLKRTHFLGGRQMFVQQRELRKHSPDVKPGLNDHSNFIVKLKNVGKLQNQVNILTHNLEMNSREHQIRYNIVCEDLLRTISYRFPYCEIYPFGSTITGLSFKHSDLDVFISGIKHSENDVPFLYMLKGLLLESQMFVNTIVIAHAKIPILKCIHKQTGISCDINLRNMLGICNTNLINFYLNIDMKIRMLLIILKYWAKIHRITGQNHLFTNYSLSLMVIYFLQQEPFKLPSVLRLQGNPHFNNLQDGWNGGFQPIKMFNMQLKSIPLLKLLGMFFEFYAQFEYGVNIICPYLGKPMRKDQFKNFETLPDFFYIYKKHIRFGKYQPLKVDTSICIQDPFEHCRNNTPIISDVTLSAFVSFCQMGKKICEGEETGVLYKLLTEEPPNIKSALLMKSTFTEFSIPLSVNLKYLEKTMLENVERHVALRKAWFQTVNDFLKITLKDFLRLELDEISAPACSSKVKKVEGQSDIHDKNDLQSYSYKCSGKLNFWQARKSVANNIKETEVKGLIEKEKLVTSILSERYKDITLAYTILEFEVTIGEKRDPPRATIAIEKISSHKKTFKSFASFYTSWFPHLFNVYEKELNAV